MTAPTRKMPLDHDGIKATFEEWIALNIGKPQEEIFAAGYNQGAIDTLHFVGEQDQICWDNGYAQALRDVTTPPSVTPIFPAGTRFFRRKHVTGLGRFNYAAMHPTFDRGIWIEDDGKVVMMCSTWSMTLEEFETCVKVGLWSELEEMELPSLQPRPKIAVATPPVTATGRPDLTPEQRMENVLTALEADKEESPYTQEEWDRIDQLTVLQATRIKTLRNFLTNCKTYNGAAAYRDYASVCRRIRAINEAVDEALALAPVDPDL